MTVQKYSTTTVTRNDGPWHVEIQVCRNEIDNSLSAPATAVLHNQQKILGGLTIRDLQRIASAINQAINEAVSEGHIELMMNGVMR